MKKNIAIIGVGVVTIPVLSQLLAKLSERFNITVYSFIAIDPAMVPAGIRVRSLKSRWHTRLAYCLLAGWFIIDHLRLRYDVIHAQSAFPGGVLARWLSKFLSIRYMVTLIGGEVECMPEIPFGDLRDIKLRATTKRVCSDAQILSVMSAYQANSVRKNLVLDRTIKVLPYAPVVMPIAKRQISSPLKLLHIANAHPVKNHDMLYRCITRLLSASPLPISVTIVGANYSEEFKRKMQSLRLEHGITFTGEVSYLEINNYLHASDILIHTSWYEGLPTVAFEAMAAGVVVCGTNVGLLSDLANTHCLTVDVDDDKSLTDCILRLANDQTRYSEIRKRAYEWATANDQQHFVRQQAQWWEELSKK